MNIDAIHIYSNSVKRVELHLDRSDPTHSYIIETSSGLDAPDIIPRSYTPGSALKYYNLTAKKRQIALKIKLNPQWGSGETYSVLRDTIYRAIASSRTGLIQLRFMNGTTTVAVTSGFVKKLESDLFSKDSVVQLTMDCDDGFLKGIEQTEPNIAFISKVNPILTDTVSTAPHGFRFSITYTSFRSSFSMSAVDNEWVFFLSYAMSAGDVLQFSSEKDNQYIRRIRAGVTLNLADKLIAGSVWPIMFPGVNNFAIAGSAGFNWDIVSWYDTFWGV